MTPSGNRFERNWVGVLVPGVLLVALVADGLSRFMSIDPVTIRAWEAVTRNAFTEGGIPLEPSKRYVNDHAFGDLAAATNRREMREYHREVFTSDAWGYRNLEAADASRPPDAILLGTSFSIGSGVSDDETLSARLSQETGRRIYNAAGTTPSPELVKSVAERLGMREGTVFYEVLETNRFPVRPRPISRYRRACFDLLGPTCLRVKGWSLISPVGIVSHQSYHRLQDDIWLPNTPAARAIRDLVGGVPVLFGERDAVSCPDVTPERARDYFKWFGDGLSRLNLSLIVILVPTKWSVYGPPSAQPCFGTINRALEDLSIKHVDLTEALREAARVALARREFLYFRGDTHWNAAGIQIAAKVIAHSWQQEPPRAGLR
jgi:hypothetical protein